MFLDNSWMCYFRVCLLVYQLGQRNKNYQRYVYLFCFCTREKVEEIETFTLIKEKGILWDRGNLFLESWNWMRGLSEKKEKLKGQQRNIHVDCGRKTWIWPCFVSFSVGRFFSTVVMFCSTTHDNDGDGSWGWMKTNQQVITSER